MPPAAGRAELSARVQPNGAPLFDIRRDMAIVRGGGCFCRACLTGKPAAERSPVDWRYCRGCQELIEAEYQARVEGTDRPLRALYRPSPEPPNGCDPLCGTCTEIGNCESGQNYGCQIGADNGNRGPYQKKPLPEQQIHELAGQGLGAKAIAGRLALEGTTVSYRTVHRIMRGERRQELPLLYEGDGRGVT